GGDGPEAWTDIPAIASGLEPVRVSVESPRAPEPQAGVDGPLGEHLPAPEQLDVVVARSSHGSPPQQRGRTEPRVCRWREKPRAGRHGDPANGHVAGWIFRGDRELVADAVAHMGVLERSRVAVVHGACLRAPHPG